jgi:adenylyltransferase/sulfurtransferase
LAPVAKLEGNRFLLKIILEGYQLTVFPNGRAVVSGTTDPGVAKSLYARYVGA